MGTSKQGLTVLERFCTRRSPTNAPRPSKQLFKQVRWLPIIGLDFQRGGVKSQLSRQSLLADAFTRRPCILLKITRKFSPIACRRRGVPAEYTGSSTSSQSPAARLDTERPPWIEGRSPRWRRRRRHGLLCDIHARCVGLPTRTTRPLVV